MRHYQHKCFLQQHGWLTPYVFGLWCVIFPVYLSFSFFIFSEYDSPDHRAVRGPQKVAGRNGDSGTHGPRTHAWNNGLTYCASKRSCLGLKCNDPKDTASLLRKTIVNLRSLGGF